MLNKLYSLLSIFSYDSTFVFNAFKWNKCLSVTLKWLSLQSYTKFVYKLDFVIRISYLLWKWMIMYRGNGRRRWKENSAPISISLHHSNEDGWKIRQYNDTLPTLITIFITYPYYVIPVLDSVCSYEENMFCKVCLWWW